MTQQLILKRLSVIMVALLLSVTLLLPVIASAHGDAPENGSGDEKVRLSNSEVKEQVEARVKERQEVAKARLENRKEKSQELRQEQCEKRQAKVNQHIQRLSEKASNHLAVMDRFFERVQGFYDKGQLTVDNYEELKAAAETAQEAAQVEVDALAELVVVIDCTDPDVSIKIGSFRDSADAAREALKAYRKSLVALISAMRSAAAEDKESTDEGSGEDDGEDGQENTDTEQGGEEETTDNDNSAGTGQ